MAYGDPIMVVYPGDRTANGNSGILAVEDGINLSLMVEATASSGTPSVTLTIEWSMDGVNSAVVDGTADTFAALTTAAPTRVVKVFTIKAPFYRIVWAITGTTPHMTFQITRFVTGR